MTAVNSLLGQVRSDAEVKSVNQLHARGVEEFLLAYEHVASENPNETPLRLCELAESYIFVEVAPPLHEMELRAASKARDVLLRLAAS